MVGSSTVVAQVAVTGSNLAPITVNPAGSLHGGNLLKTVVGDKKQTE